MDNKYKEHFLLNNETVLDYVKDVVGFFDQDAELSSSEIGDGNINYVFKVIDKKTGKSLVLKQADSLLRSSGRPLDIQRSQIEADILAIEASLAPGFVPEVYHYHKSMAVLAMEDISAYKNLRSELAKGKTFDHLAENISEFMVNSLLATTDLIACRHKKKRLVGGFINVDLCDISEDLVFTEPYYDYKGRNIITEGNEEYVKNNLYNNSDLIYEVACLRNKYMNYAQALVHGDLHSGSIFINDEGLKVIDPEFAFYGPMGYDIGNVIANLFFSLATQDVAGNAGEKYITWIKATISDVFDKTNTKLHHKYDELVEFELYKNEKFKCDYLNDILSDSLGYAGTEMIRRVVGDSKVAELNDFEDKPNKLKVERALIKIGSNLIINRSDFKNGAELIELYNETMKNELGE